MALASGARMLAAAALGAAVFIIAPASPMGAVPRPAEHVQAGVFIKPGAVHLRRDRRQGPSNTAQCQQALHISCYNPAQVQQAYSLPTLYAKGVNGKGVTIVIVDPYGSPTISSDLSTFDSDESLPAPPSLRIIKPAGKVPSFNPNNSDMVGWATETTLDVEWAHVIAPGAKILLVETPGAKSNGGVSMAQIVTAEKYVIGHHLGDVISQSFVATEQAVGSATIESLRGAYTEAYSDHVTVVTGSGDSGAAGYESNQSTYYTYPVTMWPASDPLVTAVGGTRLSLDGNGNRGSADTVWNDTYNKATNQLVNGNAGPSPLASGGGKSVVFGRPTYQNGVAGIVGNHRGVPDISMSAACSGAVNVYQSFGGQQAGWYALCGTSEAAPLFAGIVALADQMAGHPLGLINPALYKMAAEHLPGLVRVTSGNNTVTFRQSGRSHTVHGYSAEPHYNLATGLGTINAAYFVPELARLA
jgi:subtilase family serine protease